VTPPPDSDERDGGRRQKPHGIVRPYVLNAGHSARQSPTRRDTAQRDTAQRDTTAGNPLRGGRPALDWTGDRPLHGMDDARFTSTRHDAPTRPRPAKAPLPRLSFGAGHRASKHGTKRRWLAIIVAVWALVAVGALAVVGGTILFLSRPSSKPLAGTSPPASRHRAIPRPRPAATHSTARPSPRPTRTHPTPNPSRSSAAPASTPTPTSTPTASHAQQVKVSYAVVRQHPHSFQGQFTIVNDGSTAVTGWKLVVVLPGDRIHAVWDGSFNTDGDTLYIEPSTSQQTIAPGASLTENLTAHGSTTTPTSCTFNGSAC
jgi:hypothetical protein